MRGSMSLWMSGMRPSWRLVRLAASKRVRDTAQKQYAREPHLARVGLRRHISRGCRLGRHARSGACAGLCRWHSSEIHLFAAGSPLAPADRLGEDVVRLEAAGPRFACLLAAECERRHRAADRGLMSQTGSWSLWDRCGDSLNGSDARMGFRSDRRQRSSRTIAYPLGHRVFTLSNRSHRATGTISREWTCSATIAASRPSSR